VPLDDLVHLVRDLHRKADELEQAGAPPPRPPRKRRN
jgi:hypothetical protein